MTYRLLFKDGEAGSRTTRRGVVRETGATRKPSREGRFFYRMGRRSLSSAALHPAPGALGGDLGIMALSGCVAIVVRIPDGPAGVDLLANDVRPLG